MNRMQVDKAVLIRSAPLTVWKILTDPVLIKQWMGEPENEIGISSEWKVNSPIIITGFHHVRFENKGMILQFEPGKNLTYTHLSSVSRLDDKPENYSVLEFKLAPVQDLTSLTLTIRNFPTETIFKHLDFYWGTTLEMIKDLAEKQMTTIP